MKEGLVIAGICLALILLYVLLTYFKFASLRKRVRNQMEQIDSHLKNRYDLAYQLIDDAKKYAFNEQDAIEDVIRVRLIAMGRNDISEKARDNEKLKAGIENLLSAMDGNLQAEECSKIAEIKSRIENTNDQIASAKAYYNDTVYKYNKSIKSFPGNIIAKIGRFYKAQQFVCEGTETEGLGYAMRIL